MKKMLHFATGIVVGAALFGGGTALAAGLMAEPSSQTFYLRDKQIQLEAYAIGGSNYVKLRDIGRAVGFNVTYDASRNAAVIDPDTPYIEDKTPTATTATAPAKAPAPAANQPYTISTGHWSREDFSKQANPAVFTGVYDRELYNTVRQSLVDMGTDNSAGSGCAYTMVSKAEYSAVKYLLGRLDGLYRYEHYVPQNLTNYYEYLDFFAVSVETPESVQPALDFIRPVIETVGRMRTDGEKVTYLNDYLCSLMRYKVGKTAGITRTFSPHDGELEGSCASYTYNFKFLCAAAGVPCFTVSTKDHAWNLVYADGQWLHVDVAANDLYNRHDILLKASIPGRTDEAPEATAFLKELLAPGSTK